jgi:hypothetical protein
MEQGISRGEMRAMSGAFADEGNLSDLPWASVFDPAANARALSAIQAEGFRAASQLVDRFVRIARPDADSATAAGASDRPGLEQLSRAWWSIAGQFLLGAAADGRTREADLDLGSADGQHGVSFSSAIPGRAETVVWLHNRTDRDYGRITLRCSDLLARDGAVIRSCELTLQPAVVPMPARCSRGVAVTVQVPGDARTGVYRGTLLVDVDDDLWLPVVLELHAAPS